MYENVFCKIKELFYESLFYKSSSYYLSKRKNKLFIEHVLKLNSNLKNIWRIKDTHAHIPY